MPALDGRSWATLVAFQRSPLSPDLVPGLCGCPSTAVAVFPRDAPGTVSGTNLAAIATLLLVGNIPDPKGNSCTARGALPPAPVCASPSRLILP